jgi:hypothetical protein
MMTKHSHETDGEAQNAAAGESEDDYMSMVIQDPGATKKESSLQRAARRKKENESKARMKSKEEQKAEQAATREEALGTAIDSSNKGFRMMAKLGFKPGMTLGKEGGRPEPIKVSMKEDRGGIGLDAEKKRKWREQYEQQEKRAKLTEEEYRERRRQEREEQRTESQVVAAQKVTETLDTKEEEDASSSETIADSKSKRNVKALRHINVLWRGIARQRAEKENDEQARRLMHQSLSMLPTYDDPDESAEDKFARHTQDAFEVELEEEDVELDEFNALPPSERLEKLLMYLRGKHHYCFWCKYQYPDDTMDGCPGITEADHD